MSCIISGDKPFNILYISVANLWRFLWWNVTDLYLERNSSNDENDLYRQSLVPSHELYWSYDFSASYEEFRLKTTNFFSRLTIKTLLVYFRRMLHFYIKHMKAKKFRPKYFRPKIIPTNVHFILVKILNYFKQLITQKHFICDIFSIYSKSKVYRNANASSSSMLSLVKASVMEAIEKPVWSFH